MSMCDCNQGRTPCTCKPAVSKPTPPALGEFALEERDQLLDRIKEQAREIERLTGVTVQRSREIQILMERELAAMKAQPSGVLLPEPMKRGDEGGSGEYGAAMIRGYNACLREVARLNACQVSAAVPECPPGHELVAVPIDYDDSAYTPCDSVGVALNLLDFGLMFALCNRDHGGTRRDVKKAQRCLEDLKRLLAAAPSAQQQGGDV